MINVEELKKDMREKGYRARAFCYNHNKSQLAKLVNGATIDIVSGEINGMAIIGTDLISFNSEIRPVQGEGIIIYDKPRTIKGVKVVTIPLTNLTDYRM